jgi:hypothetical protein
MTTKQHCILITGIGHSGTRLAADMLSQHPDVSLPKHILHNVLEYPALMEVFHDVLDPMPLESAEYPVKQELLDAVLEDYMNEADQSKKFVVVKAPLHPFFSLSNFSSYFDGKISFLYLKRPLEKTINSYVRRGQHISYVENEIIFGRLVKQLPAEQRLSCWNAKDFDETIRLIDMAFDQKADEWNKLNPQNPIITVNIDEMSSSADYLNNLLAKISLDNSPECMDLMFAIVNNERLIHGKQSIATKLNASLVAPLKKIVKRVIKRP